MQASRVGTAHVQGVTRGPEGSTRTWAFLAFLSHDPSKPLAALCGVNLFYSSNHDAEQRGGSCSYRERSVNCIITVSISPLVKAKK